MAMNVLGASGQSGYYIAPVLGFLGLVFIVGLLVLPMMMTVANHLPKLSH
jgi:hypothetical protein